MEKESWTSRHFQSDTPLRWGTREAEDYHGRTGPKDKPLRKILVDRIESVLLPACPSGPEYECRGRRTLSPDPEERKGSGKDLR